MSLNDRVKTPTKRTDGMSTVGSFLNAQRTDYADYV